MYNQQIQLNRVFFVEEVPEEIERLFRKSASSLAHSFGDPLIELTTLLEQKNYVVFLEKLHQFRESLGRADMLLQDCDGIIRNYINITTQPQAEQQSHDTQGHGKPNPELEAILSSLQNKAEEAQTMREKMENKNVQEG
jgi:hypothetical protein